MVQLTETPTLMSNSQLDDRSNVESKAPISVAPSTLTRREWLAKLKLQFGVRNAKTVLRRVEHFGPLRVQKPFYPEENGCCHIYLLHPPGGMVVGDELRITAELDSRSYVLMTTPSAGKLYGAQHLPERQCQYVEFSVPSDGCLEWLPQETIVFNGANGQLNTRIDLAPGGKFFVWDIVRLGRAASGDHFVKGQCRQSLEVWQAQQPVFIERNVFLPDSEMSRAYWGLQNANTSATLCASISASRDDVDKWLAHLQEFCGDGMWGLTQKQQSPPIFVARYLGHSILDCRRGFEYLWQECRPLLNTYRAIAPRIWNT